MRVLHTFGRSGPQLGRQDPGPGRLPSAERAKLGLEVGATRLRIDRSSRVVTVRILTSGLQGPALCAYSSLLTEMPAAEV